MKQIVIYFLYFVFGVIFVYLGKNKIDESYKNNKTYYIEGKNNIVEIINDSNIYNINYNKKSSFLISLNSISNLKLKYKNCETNIYEYMDEFNIKFDIKDKNNKIGNFNLDLRFIENGGLIYYIYTDLNDENINFNILLENDEKEDLIYNNLEGENVESKVFSNNNKVKIQPKNNNFFKIGKNEVFFSNIYNLKSLSNKVFKPLDNEESIVFLKSKYNKSAINFNLKGVNSNKTFLQGYISEENHLDFENEDILKNLNTMSFGKRYFIMKDGVYWQNFKTYEPYEDNSYFRCPSALLIKRCLDLKDNSFFKSYAVSMAYSYLNEYNDLGYIPNKSKSKLLYEKYKIDRDFYDTRWNTDTFHALIDFYNIYKENEIKDVIDKYYEFFYNYAKTNSFYVDNNFFISDYMDSHNNDIKTYCSLNHYLAEMNSLFSYYKVFRDNGAYNLAFKMLNSINKTSDMWIKENNDLYYSLDYKGDYNGVDYDFVTYNDLTDTIKILKELNIKVPKGINKIYLSKEEFLTKNNKLK